MDVVFLITNLLTLLALLQGTIFACLLIVGQRKNPPSIFLGLFLLTYSFELLVALIDGALVNQYPSLYFVPLTFYYLSPLLFYLYAKTLVAPFRIKSHFEWFLPALAEFVLFSTLFFLPTQTKLALYENHYFEVFDIFYTLGAAVYGLFYMVKTILLVREYQTRAKDFFSNLEKRRLKWLNIATVYLMSICCLWIFSNLVESSNGVFDVTYVLVSLGNVVFIYWVGIWGVRQTKIELHYNDNIQQKILSDSQYRNTTSLQPILNIPQSKVSQKYQHVLTFLKEHKPYLEPDLTLAALALQLRISTRVLSQIINQNAKTNFNHFINQYRIAHAKKLLMNPDYDRLNMRGIAQAAGFNSKTSFFTTFKKFTFTTPSSFKKKRAQKN